MLTLSERVRILKFQMVGLSGVIWRDCCSRIIGFRIMDKVPSNLAPYAIRTGEHRTGAAFPDHNHTSHDIFHAKTTRSAVNVAYLTKPTIASSTSLLQLFTPLHSLNNTLPTSLHHPNPSELQPHLL